MKTKRLAVSAISAISMILALSTASMGSGDEPTDQTSAPGAKPIDPVLVSFARDMQHEAVPMAPPLRESIAEDQMYQAVNQVHWTNLQEVTKKIPSCVPGVADISPGETDSDSGTEPASGTNCDGNEIAIQVRVMPAAAIQ